MTHRIVIITVLVTVICSILVGAIILAISYFTEKRYRSFKDRNIPYVKRSVLNNHLRLLFSRNNYGDETFALYKGHDRKKYIGFHALNSNHILIRNITMIKAILIDDFSYFQERTTCTITYKEKSKLPIWGTALSLSAEDWKTMRHLLSSHLASKPFLSKCFKQCTRSSERLCADIERLLGPDRQADAAPSVAEYSAATTADCVLGGEQTAPCSAVCGLLRTVREHLKRSPTTTDVHRCGIDFNSDYRCVRTIQRRLRTRSGGDDLLGFLAKFRNRHVAYDKPTASIVVSERAAAEGARTVHASHDVLVSLAYLACVTGFEGSRSVIAWALLEIARHPEVQEKVHEEIEDALARSGGVVSYGRMLEMEYLDMVLNEVLRLHPPIATISRKCIGSYSFTGDRLKLESGDDVVVSVKGLHTDPKHWKDPQNFDPDRFDPNDDGRAQHHPCAFIPFGRGPRHCLGIGFAKLQYLTALFHLLRRFRVEAVADVGAETSEPPRASGRARARPPRLRREWEHPPHCTLYFYSRSDDAGDVTE